MVLPFIWNRKFYAKDLKHQQHFIQASEHGWMNNQGSAISLILINPSQFVIRPHCTLYIKVAKLHYHTGCHRHSGSLKLPSCHTRWGCWWSKVRLGPDQWLQLLWWEPHQSNCSNRSGHNITDHQSIWCDRADNSYRIVHQSIYSTSLCTFLVHHKRLCTIHWLR